MDKLIDKFDSVISLGYNCYGKMYLNLKSINQETQFFDYIGTSAWSIIELLEKNFDGFFDKENYKLVNLMKHGDDQYIVINSLYFIRCKHEFKKSLNQKFTPDNVFEKKIDENELYTFLETMKRRKERFMNLFSEDNKSILFIRYEEDPTGRLDFPEYEDKLNIPYMENLIKLLEILKKINPTKRIVILDVSHRHDKTEYLKSCGIIKVKMGQRVDHWTKAVRDIDETLKSQSKFLESIEL